LYFLPDQVLLFEGSRFSGIEYSAVATNFRTVRTAQLGNAAGMEVQGYTWLHTRMDGFADLRYKYNPQMSIVVYGQVTFASPNGFQVHFQTSPSSHANSFYYAFAPQPRSQNTGGSSRQSDGGNSGTRDVLFNQALRICVEMKRASTSVLQNRLKIGYGRAAPIIDMMEREGYVGQANGALPRILLGKAYETVASWDKRSALPKATASSPHGVLGVPTTATREEITRAYKLLAQQYHPDKVNHLAPEFRELAERKMREINAAYKTITGSDRFFAPSSS
jgi:hypothetical protein